MARPDKWKDEYLRIVEHACKLGATDAEVADMLQVSLRTLNYWKIDRPELMQAMKVGKAEADDRVERSLFARANGYEHEEVDIRVVGGEIVQTPLRKYYPPDTTAAIFWLKNRRQAEWRDIKAVELSGANGGAIQNQTKLSVGDLSTEQLRALATIRLPEDVEGAKDVAETPAKP